LLDLAEVVPPSDLERAIDASERLRLFDLRAIEDVIARSPGRRGQQRLRRALAAYELIPFTRSELERLFLDRCRDAGLPPPAVNVLIAGFEVDAVWEDAKLVVELDSRTFHDTAAAFEEDRARDATLQLAGYRVIRVTYRRLLREPQAVMQTIRCLLRAG
jgi:hypothetical protein